MSAPTTDYRLIDSTLRDGSHAISHRFTAEQVRHVVAALDGAGVPVIEVTHGDGMGGSSFNYGFSHTPETDLLKVAVETAQRAKIAVLFVPGIGVKDDLRHAADLGVKVARVATHCTEADIAEQHLQLTAELGMEPIGFLMMSHMVTPEQLAEQARKMESYGASTVYVVDSAGAMTTDDFKRRVAAVKAEVDVEVGVHAHNNLSLAVANSLGALAEGATNIDGCATGLGAGAGNCPTEVLVATSDKLGLRTGVDTFAMMDAAHEVVRPIRPDMGVIDRDGLMLGYAGVYGSFLLHARRASERYGVDTRDILVELGRRGMVGGQEDMIIDVALALRDGRVDPEAAR
jgi:4-hydroxy 2-oxovalerate aldolase